MNFIGNAEFPVDPNAVPYVPTPPSSADMDQLTNAMSSPNSRLMLNTAMARGNDVAQQNQIIQDRQNLSPMEFIARYGADVAQQMDLIHASDQERFLLENTDRSYQAALGDNVNNVLTGFVGGLGDATTFVGGMVNDDAGRVISEGTKAFRNGMHSLQSARQAQNRRMSGIRAVLDREDNNAQYERDLADGESGFVAGLSYLGRGMVNGTSRFIEDPMSLQTGVAEGVGSVFSGGVIGKGLSILGKLGKLGKSTTSMMMPAAIGAMEGGSAYSAALQQVMGMSHEELLNTSPTYRTLLASGMEPEAAKEEVAARAATTAGAIQFPVGAVTGTLVSRFESNPFGSRGFRDMVENILRETVEEGIQGGSGQFARNVGIQNYADENQGMLEGIGDQVAQGAILGSLTTGVIQAPSVPGATLRAVGAKLTERGEAVAAQNEAGSTVSLEEIQKNSEALAESLPTIAAEIPTMTEGLNEDVKDEMGADTLPDRVDEAMSIKMDDMRNLGKEVRDYLRDNFDEPPKTRHHLLMNTARMLLNKESSISEEAKVAGGLFLLNELNNQERLFNEDLEEVKGNLAQDSDAYNAIKAYQDILAEINKNPEIRAAIDYAQKNSDVLVPDEGPISAQTLENAKNAAKNKPDALTAKGTRTILKQADEGKVTLTSDERKTFENLRDMLNISEKANAETTKVNTSENVEEGAETDALKDVGNQIMSRGRKEEWGLSVNQHIGRINKALLSGNKKELKYALSHYGNFTKSQRNKAYAVIRSMRKGGEQAYTRLGSYNRVNPENGKLTMYPNNSGSLAFGRRVIIEANAMIDQHNEMIKNNPAMGDIMPMARVEMAKELFGPQAAQTPAPKRGTVQAVLDDYADRMKGRVTKIANHTFKSQLAGYNRNKKTIYIDVNKIEEDFKAGLKYLSGIHGNETLQQKRVVFKGVNTTAFRDHILKGGVEMYAKFIIEHELQHVRQLESRGEVYPRTKEKKIDLMHEDAIRLERDANEAGFAAIGFDPKASSTPTSTTIPGAADTSKALKTPVERKFPFLVRPKDLANRMVSTFRGTRFGPLLNRISPLNEFITASTDSTSVIEFVGKEPNFDLDDIEVYNPDYVSEYDDTSTENDTSRIEAFSEYLNTGNDLKAGLKARLEAFMKGKYSKTTDKTHGDMLRNGEDVAGLITGRATAIVDNIDGNYQYNEALLETAILAALDWYSASQNRTVILSKEDLAKSLGIDISQLTNAKVDEFNRGVGQTLVTRTLADYITDYWGMDAFKDVPQNYVLGISEGVAKEILRVMEDQQWMAKGKIFVPGTKGPYTQYYFGKRMPSNMRKLMMQMGPAKKLLQLAAIKKNLSEEAVYYKPSKRIAKTQLKNPAIENTRSQRNVLRKVQAIPHYLYRNSHDMLQAIGINSFIELMGSRVITDDMVLNDENRKSVEGRNLTMSMAFEAMVEQVNELDAMAEKDGVVADDVKKFYQFNYNVVGRLQMLGFMNPVLSKISRHVWMPTRATVDLTDSKSKHSLGFFLSLAQGVGIDVKKHTPEQNAQMVQDQLFSENGKYAEVTKELAQWLKDGKEGSLSEWSQKLREVDPSITEHGIMSLLAAAEYMNARDTDNGSGLASFTTHSYFEADGVTNGPANALMNLAHRISPEWINTLRKVGSFIGHSDYTMLNQTGIPDLYETSSDALASIQGEFVKGLPDNVREIYDALFNLMRSMGMGITFEDDGQGGINIKIDRGTSKQPLTITIYGSGVNGIAGNVANEMMDLIFEAMSEHLQDDNKNSGFGDNLQLDGEFYGRSRFWNDMKKVLYATASYDKESGWMVMPIRKGVKAYEGSKIKDFKLTSEGFEVLRDNVRALFVDNMNAAIEHTVMGHVSEMVDNIQKATNAQSIIMHFMFRKKIIEAMLERQQNPDKFPKWKPGDFLSQTELDGIIKDLLPYGPVIRTEHQSYFMGGGERGNILPTMKFEFEGKEYSVRMPKEFSADLQGGTRTDAYAFAPSIIGVAGVPSFNIGTGDGRMIDVFIQLLQDYGVLPVYDGINLPVDRVFEGSELANKAVSQTWQENPAKYAAESLTAFLRLNPINLMTDPKDPMNVETEKLLLALTQNFEEKKTVERNYTPEDVMVRLANLNRSLTEGAQDIGNRIEATKAMPNSIDQMAGASTGYQQEGTIKLPPNATDAQIAAALQKETNRIERAKKKEAAVEEPSKNFLKVFGENANLDTDSGAQVANITQLASLREKLNKNLSNTHKEMMKAALENLQDSDYRVVYGTADQISLWELNNLPDTFEPNQDNYFGKIDVENRVIFITNPSVETLTHELLHASTTTKMQGYYYGDADALTKADQEAIHSMELLLDEWQQLSFDNESTAVASAHGMALSTIMKLKREGKPAEALNEFLAWSLSNQNIISMQKKLTVKNQLARIMGKALTALKQLIWGKSKAPDAGTDMFSNVKFNARVLMATPTPFQLFLKDYGDVVMYQSPIYGSNPRLSKIRKGFYDQLKGFLKTNKSNDANININEARNRRTKARSALIQYGLLAKKMAIPFKFDMQQMSTFRMIGATMFTATDMNTVSLGRIQAIYDRVIDKLSFEDFLTNVGDPGLDKRDAEAKYNALTGIGTTEYDEKGRSSQLANFIALAAVDEQFRAILRQMKMPADTKNKGIKLDDLVDRAGAFLSGHLSNYVSGGGKKDADFEASMDALTQELINFVGDERSFIEQQVDKGLDNTDNIIKSYMEKGADKIQKWAKTVQNPQSKKAAALLSTMSQYLTLEGTRKIHEAQVSFFNQPQMNTTMREINAEKVGRTEVNAPIFDQITRGRTAVDQSRQKLREEFPEEIKAWFNGSLTTEQWSILHRMLGHTDAALLFKAYGEDRSMELLSSGSKRKAEIKKLEKTLNGMTIQKSKQLANFMVTGEAGALLQTNAYSIASNNGNIQQEQIIDHLVTLYAMEQMPEASQQYLADLIAKDQPTFMNLYMSLLATRNDEVSRNSTDKARMNGYKGYLKGQSQKGVHMVIDSKTEHAKYMSMGYVEMADYKGSSADIGMEKKAYYFAPVSGQAKYNQGTIQTVHQTQLGVDPNTGFTVGTINAGIISDARAVAAITRRINNQLNTDENLRPIYNMQNVVIAYERLADPKMLSYLNTDLDLAKAIGAWRGRQFEERSAEMVNFSLVDKVHKIWEDHKTTDKNVEFIALDKSKDPIHMDAWNVLPKDVKDYIKQTFGDTGFMVRADMINDVVGGRSASVGDFWTGNSRWSPQMQKNVKDIIIGFGGNKAYRYLVNAEKFMQEQVLDAKVAIVIKSVIVPAINIVSNINQLSMAEVPWREIIKGYRDKTVELNNYLKRKEFERQLENKLFVAEAKKDFIEARKLTIRIQSLRDSFKNMSIWPLIEAGEYTAVTDGGITKEDLDIAKNGYGSVIENMVKHLPKKLQDIGRYAVVSRDTSMFKILSRATQYGDFIAKSIQYDHMTKRQGMESLAAIAKVNEWYVNYNRFAGRTRVFQESMGLTWFYQYKIRSIKVAHQTMQENPVRALLHLAFTPRLPLIGTVGNPLKDNFLSVLFDGRLGYSTGPGMLFRAPALNPWWNLTN